MRVVHGLSRELGGTLTVGGEGRGTRFSLDLPANAGTVGP